MIDARNGILGEDQLSWVVEAVEESSRTWKVGHEEFLIFTHQEVPRQDGAMSRGGDQVHFDKRTDCFRRRVTISSVDACAF